MLQTREIQRQLRQHVPFTALGTASGIVLMLGLLLLQAPRHLSETLFWTLHPAHVLLSALVTAAMYRQHSRRGLVPLFVVGYLGSVGIATVSDSLIPYAGEWLLQLPNRGLHLGFVEKWWLVNPLAFLGIAVGAAWPRTRFTHAGHVFLSTWASLFHMTMAANVEIGMWTVPVITVFLFLAVWVPCCTSDIVFPLLLAGHRTRNEGNHDHATI